MESNIVETDLCQVYMEIGAIDMQWPHLDGILPWPTRNLGGRLQESQGARPPWPGDAWVTVTF